MTMMKTILSFAVVLALAVLIAGCGDDDADEAPAPAPAEAQTDTSAGEDRAEKPKPGTEIKLAGSQFGEILFDSADRAIYLFDKEKRPESECYGDCAAAWPPVITAGAPVAGAGVASGRLGTTERSDGSQQVTYNGHPLYYYVDDPPGEVLCHNVDEFGGLWLVVDRAGNAVS